MKRLLVFILTMFASFMLFACGEDKLVIEFDTAGGNAISNVELELDKLGDFKLPEVPVKEGFEFKGWYLDAEFKNEFKSLEGFEGTVKLYAKWEEVPADPTQTYKVSFYVDGNLVDTFEGMGLALVYPEVEAKDGKAFMGWYTDSECTNLFKELGNELEVSLYGKYIEVAADSVLVKYVINGKAYNNVLVKKTDLSLDAPELEDNYEFLGWYKDLYMTEKFEALADEKEVELYGISVPTLNGTYEYSLSSSMNESINGQAMETKVELSVKLQLKDFNLINYKDSELALVIEATVPETEKMTLDFYMKDGKLYHTDEGQLEYIDIEKMMPEIIEEYKAMIASMLEQKDEIEEDPMMGGVSSILMETLMNMELTAEQEAELKELVNVLKPTEVKEGNKVTYTITDAQIQSFIAKLAEFVSNNAKDILKDVLPLIIGQGSTDELEQRDYVDENGNVFKYGEAGWYDASGAFHSYAEDTELNYGMVNSFGYYVPYYVYGTAFDTNDNYKLILGVGSLNWETMKEVFITFDPDGWYAEENGKVVFHSVNEDFTAQNFGYVDGDIYYAYSGNMYNVTTGELVSQEDLMNEQIDEIIAEAVASINMISTLFKANALQSKVEIYDNNAGCKVELLGDITMNIPDESGNTMSMNYKLNEVVEIKISQEVPTITFPSFDGAVDATQGTAVMPK